MLTALLLIAGHFIGDWFCQTRYMARNKSKYISVLLMHVLIVVCVLNTFLLIVKDFNDIYIPLLIYGLAHGIQDWFIWRIYARYYYNPQRGNDDNPAFFNTIAIDQMLHLGLLVYLFC